MITAQSTPESMASANSSGHDVSLQARRFGPWTQLLLLGTPLFLGILEIWHPVGGAKQTAFEAIAPRVDWWLTLHLLQVPLFGLMGLSVIILIYPLRGWPAKVSRVGVGFFLVFYTAMDAITGIAGGMLIRSARTLPLDTQQLVSAQVNQLFFDPLVGGSTLSLVGLLGAGGWLVGVSAAAVALARVHVDRITLCFLSFSAILFALSHTPPTGPLGLFFFFLATLRLIVLKSDARILSAPSVPSLG